MTENMTEGLLEKLYRHSLEIKAYQQKVQLQKINSEIEKMEVNGVTEKHGTQFRGLQAKKIKLEQEYAKTIQKLQSMGLNV